MNRNLASNKNSFNLPTMHCEQALNVVLNMEFCPYLLKSICKVVFVISDPRIHTIFQSTPDRILSSPVKDRHMAVSSHKHYCHTNKRQMNGSQSIQALLSYKQETNVEQSVHPSLTAIQIRDKYIAVSPPKPYCHTNKRQMYGSQSTQTLLPYK